MHKLDFQNQKAELRQRSAELEAQCNAIIEASEAESRGLTAAEELRFDSLVAEIKSTNQTAAELQDQREAMLEAATRTAHLTNVVASDGPTITKSLQGGQRKMSQLYQHKVGRLKAFKGENAERNAYNCGQWLKAVVARRHGGNQKAEEYISGLGEQFAATHVEGTDSLGGYLVPTPLSSSIIDVRELAGVSRQVCRIMAMSSETLAVPKKDDGLTVYYPGEAQPITESNQTWSEVKLTAIKRAILSKVSQELNDDAIISVMDDLASQMGTDLAVTEDGELINGDGTAGYGNVTGLLQSLGTAGVNTADTGGSTWDLLTLDDFISTMSLLPDRFGQYSPSWICSTQFYFGVMVKLLAEAGGNTIPVLEGGASRPYFLGYPVVLTSQMPTATAVSTVSCLFGSYDRGVILGDRMGIRIAQSEHLGFEEDTLAIRATTRYDIVVHEGGDVTNPGAYVGLSTSAT